MRFSTPLYGKSYDPPQPVESAPACESRPGPPQRKNVEFWHTAYDGRGNLVKEEEVCSPTTQGPKNTTIGTYLYDETDRMVQGTNKDGEASLYTFNGLGVRVGRELIMQDNTHGYTDFHTVAPSIETGISKPEVAVESYVVDYTSATFRTLVMEEEGGFDYRWVYGLDKLSVKITSEGTNWWAQNVKQDILKDYLHQDRMGSTTNLTDQFGRVVGRADYNEWGQITYKDALDITSSYRRIWPQLSYTGHDWDDVLGMYYAKARFYSADDKRFVAMDPVKGNITEPLSLVPYIYCVDDPLRWVDPWGMTVTIDVDTLELQLERLSQATEKSIASIKLSLTTFNQSDAIQKPELYPFSVMQDIYLSFLDSDQAMMALIRYCAYGNKFTGTIYDGNDHSDITIDKLLLEGIFRAGVGYAWDFVGGPLDSIYVSILQAIDPEVYDFFSQGITLIDGSGKEVDFTHMIATLDGQYNPIELARTGSGLVGDFYTAMRDIPRYYKGLPENQGLSLEDFYYKYLGCDFTSIDEHDILADVDAINLYQMLQSASACLPQVLVDYYSGTSEISYKNRFSLYYANLLGKDYSKLTAEDISAKAVADVLHKQTEDNWMAYVAFGRLTPTPEDKKAITNAMGRYIAERAINELESMQKVKNRTNTQPGGRNKLLQSIM